MSISPDFHSRSRRCALLDWSWRSSSRSDAAFSKSCASIARLLAETDLGDLLVDLADVGRRGHAADPHARAGLVDQVDRLVGQEPVADVAVRQVRGRDERVVGERHAVVRLVPVAQALQDLDRVRDGRLLDADRLEPPLERRVLLEVLAVLVARGGADRLELAAREHRLEDAGRVDRALGRAGADERVQLVDEQHDVAARADLLQDLLQALLEVAAVPGAGDERAEVERVDLLALEGLGDLAADDVLREALDDRRSCRRRARRSAPGCSWSGATSTCITRSISFSRPITGSSLVSRASCVRLRPNWSSTIEPWPACSPCAAGRGLALAAGVAGQELDHGLADAVEVGAELLQDLRGDALALADQAEQDVLGADVVVAELQRLAERELEDLLGARRERDVTRSAPPGPGR